MKYYVYALDAERRKITAALSFSDAEMAEEVYRMVSLEMDGDSMGVFRFGHTSDTQIDDPFAILLGNKVELIIHFISLPRLGYPDGMEMYKIFDIGKFEEAEKRTEKILSESRHIQRLDIQFMRSVKSVMMGGSPLLIDAKTENVTTVNVTNELPSTPRTNGKSCKRPDTPKKRGRKLKKRSEWVIKQRNEGLSCSEIFAKWNKLTYAERNEIDPGTYTIETRDGTVTKKNSDQFTFLSNVTRILNDFKKTK